MKKKVVFIINAIQQQRCLKRIDEFIANGYEVEVYGFSRAKTIPTQPQNFSIQVLDTFDEHTSYIQRVIRMVRSLRPIFRKYNDEDVLFYYFLLDVAMVCCMLNRKPYLYEESDLMQTYLPKPLCVLLNHIDRTIIRHSLLSLFTSEGFLQYHYGNPPYPQNSYIIPNRLNPNIEQYTFTKEAIDIKHLRISFVGHARFRSITRFCEFMLSHYPQHEIHFYGTIGENKEMLEQIKKQYANLFIHGTFSNPKDLPTIYQHTDLVLATYDTHYDNVRYAEPNKLYEAAYFNTPIIVSSNTYLAQKVEQLGIGYAIDVWNEKEIRELFDNITTDDINDKIHHCKTLDKSTLIDRNDKLFIKLKS